MNLWSIFITGLFAGGASCAAVQGGLLVSSVVRRGADPVVAPATTLPPRKKVPAGKNARRNQQRAALARAHQVELARRGPVRRRPRLSAADFAPVGAFLGGKLLSHTILGALLGLFGAGAQLSFRARALMQIGAGVLMLLMAANLLGVAGLRFLVPSPPARLSRFVRRTARSEAAFAPFVLGFSTVLIPCGVTLSVMFLAIASQSPVWGGAGMAIFVLGRTQYPRRRHPTHHGRRHRDGAQR